MRADELRWTEPPTTRRRRAALNRRSLIRRLLTRRVLARLATASVLIAAAWWGACHALNANAALGRGLAAILIAPSFIFLSLAFALAIQPLETVKLTVRPDSLTIANARFDPSRPDADGLRRLIVNRARRTLSVRRRGRPLRDRYGVERCVNLDDLGSLVARLNRDIERHAIVSRR